MADRRSAELLVSLMRTEKNDVNARDQLQALQILSGKKPSLEDEPVVGLLLTTLTHAIESRNEGISHKSSGEYAKVLLNARAAIVRLKYPAN